MDSKKGFSSELAIEEHMLSGKPITSLEASTLFCQPNLGSTLTRLRKRGYRVCRQEISYLTILRRINQFAVFQPPNHLPVTQIKCSEWWIQH